MPTAWAISTTWCLHFRKASPTASKLKSNRPLRRKSVATTADNGLHVESLNSPPLRDELSVMILQSRPRALAEGPSKGRPVSSGILCFFQHHQGVAPCGGRWRQGRKGDVGLCQLASPHWLALFSPCFTTFAFPCLGASKAARALTYTSEEQQVLGRTTDGPTSNPTSTVPH